MKNLAQELGQAADRVRLEVIPRYRAMGAGGLHPLTRVQITLAAAERAIAAGNVAEMQRCLDYLSERYK